MNLRSRFVLGGPVLLAALAISSTALAQSLPKGRLAVVFPAGARQGTTVEVEVLGDDFSEVSRLYFSHPDIKAEKQSDKDGRPRFSVTVGPQVPFGFYDVRVIHKFGVTNPRTFVVGDAPEVIEQEPNNLPGKAMSIELGSVVNGRVSPAEDVDIYRFAAKAGQRVLIECHSARIDSQLDGFMWLYDANGRQLVSNADDPSQSEKLDPMIDVTIPADGEYLVKLADFVYAGGGTMYYRLNVSTAPRIDYLLPTAGKPGESVQVSLFGRNLPGGEKTDLQITGRPLEKLTLPFAFPIEAAKSLPLSQMEVIRPYASWLSGAAVGVTGEGGRSNTKLILASSLPEVLEQEPNGKPEEAQLLPVPAAVSGQFSPVKDADYFKFEAKKGKVYSIEVFAQRISSPADPDMEVFDPKGKVLANPTDDGENIGANRFRTATQDLRFDLSASEDGIYSFRLEHLYGQNQGGPQFVYRVELSEKTDDFQILCLSQHEQRRDSDIVRQNGRERLDIAVWRLRGHNAPITVTADHLPPGVTCDPLVIAPGMKSGTLILSAAADAPIGESEFNIVAKSVVNGAEVERVCRGGAGMWDTANTPLVARMTRSLVLAVRDTAPFKVTATAPNTEIKQGDPLVVNCHVDRRADVNVEIQLSGRGYQLPPGIEVPITKVATGTADATVTLQTAKLPPATYSICLNGEGQVPFERTPGTKETIRCMLPSNLVTFTVAPKDGK